MSNSKAITLPSGSKLEITVSDFKTSKALYVAMAAEAKSLKLDPNAEVDVNFLKDIFCAGLSSKAIEESLDACMKRCTYNGLKITTDTFEPVDARQDYLMVCFEIAKENVEPFTKALGQKLSPILDLLKAKVQA